MFKKNVVYNIMGKKVCILVDSDFACLVPLSTHKHDNGYTLKLSKPAIYAADFIDNGFSPEPVGSIREGVYYPKQKK